MYQIQLRSFAEASRRSPRQRRSGTVKGNWCFSASPRGSKDERTLGKHDSCGPIWPLDGCPSRGAAITPTFQGSASSFPLFPVSSEEGLPMVQAQR